MNSRDLARAMSDTQECLRVKLTIDELYNALGGVPNYGAQMGTQKTLFFYVSSNGFCPGGSIWNDLVRNGFFKTVAEEAVDHIGRILRRSGPD
jgi:hypothetical protein